MATAGEELTRNEAAYAADFQAFFPALQALAAGLAHEPLAPDATS